MKGKEKITIYDISKKLNISAATVSRALNDSPRISQKTKELVVKAAKEMNYKQNKLALALKSGKSYNVGVIIPFINRHFFSSVIRGIEDELSPLGYRVIICQTHENVKTEIEQVETLLDAQIDGIFMSVSQTTQDTEHIKRVIKGRTPFVFFDRTKEIPGVSSVSIDDFDGAYKATQHLLEEGCTRIAHFAGDKNLDIYNKRYQGYRAALEEKGLYDDNLVIRASSGIDTGIEAVQKLWKLDQVPDAIFSSSDYAALGAMQELKRRGILIPDDVCVVGFSNEPFTAYLDPPLTTIDQSPKQMGKIAAEVFLEQANGNKSFSIEKKVVLPTELVLRDSSLRKKKKKLSPSI